MASDPKEVLRSVCIQSNSRENAFSTQRGALITMALNSSMFHSSHKLTGCNEVFLLALFVSDTVGKEQ